jgi:hypothetical protein
MSVRGGQGRRDNGDLGWHGVDSRRSAKSSFKQTGQHLQAFARGGGRVAGSCDEQSPIQGGKLAITVGCFEISGALHARQLLEKATISGRRQGSKGRVGCVFSVHIPLAKGNIRSRFLARRRSTRL